MNRALNISTVVLVALGMVACQGPDGAPQVAATPLDLDAPHIAVDLSWWRLQKSGVRFDSNRDLVSWMSQHPRLSTLEPATRARILRDVARIAERGTLPVGPKSVHPAPTTPVNPLSLIADTVVNWTLPQTKAINSSAAVLVFGATQDNASDRLIIEGAGVGTASDPSHYIGIVSNLYGPGAPVVTKSPALDAGIDGVALATSIPGDVSFTVTSAGTVYAVKTADASILWSRSLGASAAWSSPWIDFGTNTIFFTDASGGVSALSTLDGTVRWQHADITGTGAGAHASPIVFSGMVWVGADNGSLYRLDQTDGTLLGQGTNLCLNPASCDTNDQIWSGSSIVQSGAVGDPDLLFIGVNKRLIQIDVSTNGCTSASTTCAFTGFKIDEGGFTSPEARFYSTPYTDSVGGFTYMAFNNRLWRAGFTSSAGISGAFARATTPNDPSGLLRGVNPFNSGYPRGTPVVFGGQIFIGDGGGYMHRFSTSPFAESAFKSFANPGAVHSGFFPSIDSTPFIDIVGGNIYFGIGNSNAPIGAWVSLPQNFTSDTITAGPATHLRVSGPASITAGSTAAITVIALDANENPATGYLGTIHFTSSDGASTLPADYTFVAGDNGQQSFSATLRTVGTKTVTATDTATATITGTTSIVVATSVTDHLVVSSAVSSASAGAGFNVTVTAVDASGNVTPNYVGTIHFTSTDPQGTLPGNFTFVPASNHGIASFFSATAFKTAGLQTLTATDTVTATISGTSSVSVVAGAVSTLRLTPSTTTPASGAAISLGLSARDSFGNIVGTYTGSVHFTSTDGAATLPADFTFTPADGGSHSFSATLRTAGTRTITASDGTVSESATFTVQTGGANHLALTTSVGTSTAGGAFHAFVTVQDANNNPVTGYTGTIHFTSSNPQATLPANFTFTGNSTASFFNAVALKTAGAQTVTVTDTVTPGLNGSASVTVNPAALSKLRLVPTTFTPAPGNPFSATVNASDSFNNTIVGYLGTVHFTSTDGAATLPANFTYTAGDVGVHTFTNGLTLRTAGTRTVTVTDTGTPSITATVTFTVAAGAPDHFLVTTSPANPTANTAFHVFVTVKDSDNNSVAGYTGTIHFTSSDPLATLPADYTFAGNPSISLYFLTKMRTVGPQTITATDTVQPALNGTASITVQ